MVVTLYIDSFFLSLISNFKVFKGYGNKCSVSCGHMYIFPTISIYVLFPLKARTPFFMGYVVLQLNKYRLLHVKSLISFLFTSF